MKQYLQLAQEILTNGTEKTDRTGTGTKSIFGYQMRFNLQEGFPLVTTKKVHLKSIIGELLWFLSGSTNANELREKYGVSIWNEWADKETGELGRVYGAQWRSWNKYSDMPEHSIDQIQQVIDLLKNNPDSRRIIVSAWNVGELDQMALAPCHAFFQFYTRELSIDEREAIFFKDYLHLIEDERKASVETMHRILDEEGVPRRILDCQLYQRSADVFLGVPFNIASYALLTMMMAKEVNMVPGTFIWTGGDCHIYTNHIEQMKLQLSREPHKLPTMKINPDVKSIFAYTPADFTLENYTSHPPIKGAVAV